MHVGAPPAPPWPSCWRGPRTGLLPFRHSSLRCSEPVLSSTSSTWATHNPSHPFLSPHHYAQAPCSPLLTTWVLPDVRRVLALQAQAVGGRSHLLGRHQAGHGRRARRLRRHFGGRLGTPGRDGLSRLGPLGVLHRPLLGHHHRQLRQPRSSGTREEKGSGAISLRHEKHAFFETMKAYVPRVSSPWR